MNTILDTLPPKEKDIFKQIIALYDEKKYKKALKLLNKLIEMNPNFPGKIKRICFNESLTSPFYRR